MVRKQCENTRDVLLLLSMDIPFKWRDGNKFDYRKYMGKDKTVSWKWCDLFIAAP